MADKEQHATIIIRKKKGGGEAHHGGAWKVAYADFVTAMMAFFLLLWLLNATTTEQKLGISNYFDPFGAVKSQGGGTGVLGGTSPTEQGSQKAAAAPIAIVMPLSVNPPPTAGEATEIDGEPVGKKDEPRQGEESIEAQVAKKEQAEFEKAEAQLRAALQNRPEFKDLADSLLIDQTPEGLRIQLVDQDKLSMFNKGSSRLLEHAQKLLGQVASVVKSLPNKITITGHTDGLPYAGVGGYTNWELSADRANASRKTLIENGLASDRITSVVGKADRDHLYPKEPNSPRNRRISIVLLREAPLVARGAGPAPLKAADAPPPAQPEKKTANAIDPQQLPGTMGPAAPRVIEPPKPKAKP
ncbi:MAG: flagellar motor protein MotB [Alphaproteobacteria bacterium]|nr:flagellar motor protein MotB [Alphaproteobacteria bacterium]